MVPVSYLEPWKWPEALIIRRGSRQTRMVRFRIYRGNKQQHAPSFHIPFSLFIRRYSCLTGQDVDAVSSAVDTLTTTYNPPFRITKCIARLVTFLVFLATVSIYQMPRPARQSHILIVPSLQIPLLSQQPTHWSNDFLIPYSIPKPQTTLCFSKQPVVTR